MVTVQPKRALSVLYVVFTEGYNIMYVQFFKEKYILTCKTLS